ncbi:aldo/keto reductase [Flavobacterium sp.]|uniref:aldo/keto reductase n=1 Tax=Flavobacterium sp. TaxID=239 RepID=UPI002C40D520|nr:aldo/keto reductase [Flavobacterium sp.]HSD08720.1 aldo/keto reductase [Flavobacterium sp.]
MEKLDKNSLWERRKFIKNTFKFATATAFIGFGGLDLFAFPPLKKTIKKVTLNNGVKMPILGFGTMDLRDALGEKCVAEAISLGYRLIDTAFIYSNEEAVGNGIKKSGIKREELFVTSKLWVDDMGYEKAKAAFYTTLNKLGLDYLDLYLIHRPRGDVKGSWKAMEELYNEGKIKAIGVSNFDNHQLDDLIANSKIKPAINQIETHAFFQEEKAQESLNKYGIQMEAWAPFAEGRNSLFVDKNLSLIGKKYNKTNAQVSLRWLYQRGIIAIPRTSKKEHMIENLEIFDFELTKEDMRAISKLDLNKTQFLEWT